MAYLRYSTATVAAASVITALHTLLSTAHLDVGGELSSALGFLPRTHGPLLQFDEIGVRSALPTLAKLQLDPERLLACATSLSLAFSTSGHAQRCSPTSLSSPLSAVPRQLRLQPSPAPPIVTIQSRTSAFLAMASSSPESAVSSTSYVPSASLSAHSSELLSPPSDGDAYMADGYLDCDERHFYSDDSDDSSGLDNDGSEPQPAVSGHGAGSTIRAEDSAMPPHYFMVTGEALSQDEGLSLHSTTEKFSEPSSYSESESEPSYSEGEMLFEEDCNSSSPYDSSVDAYSIYMGLPHREHSHPSSPNVTPSRHGPPPEPSFDDFIISYLATGAHPHDAEIAFSRDSPAADEEAAWNDGLDHPVSDNAGAATRPFGRLPTDMRFSIPRPDGAVGSSLQQSPSALTTPPRTFSSKPSPFCERPLCIE